MSQYFENDETIKSNKKLIKTNIFDKTFSFYTDNGIFSKDAFDYGSKFLLESLPKLKGKVLDLGCGYGPIGIILYKNDSSLDIDMIDVNERAILLAKENALINSAKVNIYESNIYEKITSKYDYIITNPPIRAGKEVVKKFLFGAKDYLKKDGELWFVMRKDHGVKSMIKELELDFSIKIIDKSKGFYVISSKNIAK